MKIVWPILAVYARPAKYVSPSCLFINAWWCAMAGLVLSPGTFRAWAADCVLPPSGLVSWWPGEGNFKDIVGSNNGIPSGGATFASGQVGQAFTFDGVNEYVRVVNRGGLNPTASFTIEGWICPREDRPQVIMSKWADSPAHPNQRSYCFQTQGNQALYFSISDWSHQLDRSFHDFFTPIKVIALNKWSHVAAVYDQATGARRIYVNGVEVAARVDAPITIANGTAEVLIGAALTYGPPDSCFAGQIDELSFYATALSAAEIQAIYLAGSVGKCKPPVAPTQRTVTATATVMNGLVAETTIPDRGGGYTNNPIISTGAPFGAHVGLLKFVAPAFTDLVIGLNYQLQVSRDMKTWVNQGSPFTATSSTMIYPQCFHADNWNSLYFRLQLSP
jgi:hypothetical protein